MGGALYHPTQIMEFKLPEKLTKLVKILGESRVLDTGITIFKSISPVGQRGAPVLG